MDAVTDTFFSLFYAFILRSIFPVSCLSLVVYSGLMQLLWTCGRWTSGAHCTTGARKTLCRRHLVKCG